MAGQTPASPRPPASAAAGSSSTTADPVQAGLQSISASLQRRGYLTTEWWTTVVGGGLTVLLSYAHPGDAAAPQTAAIIAPALIAVVYSVSRTMHKSALADVLQAALPGASSDSSAPG